MNEVCVHPNSKIMPIGHKIRSLELLPFLKDRHYEEKAQNRSVYLQDWLLFTEVLGGVGCFLFSLVE